MPSFVHNTVDNPIFPNQGKRLTASIDLAVLGGNTQFYKPRVEAILFFRHLPRTSFGFRAQIEYISPVGNSASNAICATPPCDAVLPIFERLFLGGEYSVRGFDIRSIGPTRAGIVRRARRQQEPAVQRRVHDLDHEPGAHRLFFDAGQVRDFGEPFAWKETAARGARRRTRRR